MREISIIKSSNILESAGLFSIEIIQVHAKGSVITKGELLQFETKHRIKLPKYL